jgi:MFS family permease
MNGLAPSWVVDLFTYVNLAIALCYGLLAIYFIQRIKLPNRKERHPLTILACIGAGLFFVGCAHTHLDLVIGSMTDELMQHWYSWWNVISHALQALGGITFWILATFYLQLNIYDKRHYDKVQEEVRHHGD